MKTPSIKTPFKLPFLAPAVLVAALMAICPPQTRANTIALDFTGGTTGGGANFTLGWSFSLSSSILVTDLGVWDSANDFGSPVGDGLSESHLVSIWTSSGILVTSATVPAGTSGTLVDDFRYLSIAPTLLVTGDYVIGAYYQTAADRQAINATTITTASGVTYTGSRSILGNAFPPGDILTIPNSFFGPNFQFMTDLNGRAVPEGGTAFILMLSSFAAVVVTRRLCQAPSKV